MGIGAAADCERHAQDAAPPPLRARCRGSGPRRCWEPSRASTQRGAARADGAGTGIYLAMGLRRRRPGADRYPLVIAALALGAQMYRYTPRGNFQCPSCHGPSERRPAGAAELCPACRSSDAWQQHQQDGSPGHRPRGDRGSGRARDADAARRRGVLRKAVRALPGIVAVALGQWAVVPCARPLHLQNGKVRWKRGLCIADNARRLAGGRSRVGRACVAAAVVVLIFLRRGEHFRSWQNASSRALAALVMGVAAGSFGSAPLGSWPAESRYGTPGPPLPVAAAIAAAPAAGRRSWKRP